MDLSRVPILSGTHGPRMRDEINNYLQKANRVWQYLDQHGDLFVDDATAEGLRGLIPCLIEADSQRLKQLFENRTLFDTLPEKKRLALEQKLANIQIRIVTPAAVQEDVYTWCLWEVVFMDVGSWFEYEGDCSLAAAMEQFYDQKTPYQTETRRGMITPRKKPVDAARGRYAQIMLHIIRNFIPLFHASRGLPRKWDRNADSVTAITYCRRFEHECWRDVHKLVLELGFRPPCLLHPLWSSSDVVGLLTTPTPLQPRRPVAVAGSIHGGFNIFWLDGFDEVKQFLYIDTFGLQFPSGLPEELNDVWMRKREFVRSFVQPYRGEDQVFGINPFGVAPASPASPSPRQQQSTPTMNTSPPPATPRTSTKRMRDTSPLPSSPPTSPILPAGTPMKLGTAANHSDPPMLPTSGESPAAPPTKGATTATGDAGFEERPIAILATGNQMLAGISASDGILPASGNLTRESPSPDTIQQEAREAEFTPEDWKGWKDYDIKWDSYGIILM